MNEPPTHPGDQVDELIAMIAHDLRTPITAIKGFSQLALRQPGVSPQIRDCLAVAINEANRVASLVDDLVLFSQLDRDHAVRCKRVEIATVLQAAIEQAKCLDPAFDAVIENVDADAIAWCDPALTERAIVLLIGTVRKYCGRTDTIVVHLRGSSTGTIMELLPGSKVASEKLAALRRVIGARDETPIDELSPSGLGLYICRRLIEAQAGRVWIDQPPNAAARFIITLSGRASEI